MDHETATDIKRHFEVVAEGLRSEIGGLRNEIGGLRSETRAVDEKSVLRASYGDLDRRVQALER